MDEKLKPYFSDYRINVFDTAYLTDEQVKMFKSDFRIVADYFVQIRKNKEYIPTKEDIKHVDEILKLMSVLTADNRFEEIQNEEGEVRNMCEVLDKVEARGMQTGIQIGIQRKALQVYYNCIARGFSEEDAIAISGMKMEDVPKGK